MYAEYLKVHTKANHDDVEKAFSDTLFKASLSQEEYARLLGNIAQIYTLFTQLEFHSDFQTYATKIAIKQSLIERDLSNLPTTQFQHQIAPIAHSKLSDPIAKIGGMYVLLGSALGGKVIAKNLQSLPWISPELHLNFFTSNGESVFGLWNNFKSSLDEHGDKYNINRDVLIKGAKYTFSLFKM